MPTAPAKYNSSWTAAKRVKKMSKKGMLRGGLGALMPGGGGGGGGFGGTR